jgi:RNA polymerase sigma factor (sigma-70 family)
MSPCPTNRRRALLEGDSLVGWSGPWKGHMTMGQSERDVEQLVHKHQNLVYFQVNRYLQRYFVGDMEREDLVSWGMIGLVHAAWAWDPERAACFSTLACRAIERMIIRGARREWKPERAAATVSLDALMSGDEPQDRFVERLAGAENVEGDYLDQETRAAVRSAVAGLAPSQRRLIERHYFEEVLVATLAEELGVSRQWVYLRQRRALRELRAALSNALTGGAP